MEDTMPCGLEDTRKYFSLKMDVACSFQMLVPIFQTSR
jgi:hypothetical protein